MKLLPLFLIVSALYGCAPTVTKMNLSKETLGGEIAQLTMDASILEDYVSVPLINHKVINFYLKEFPKCVNGKAEKDESKNLGEATLTPEENMQTVSIPSGKKLLLSTRLNEEALGSSVVCRNAVHFTPEPGRHYRVRIDESSKFGYKTVCSISLLERIGDEEKPVKSAFYPKSVSKGAFRSGRKFNHCQSKGEE